MVKKLTRIGNSYGLILDRAVLDLLAIEPETPLEIRTDGDSLIVRPVRKSRADRVREAATRAADDHEDAFEKLAK